MKTRLSGRNILNFTDMTTWWLTCSSICVQIYIYIVQLKAFHLYLLMKTRLSGRNILNFTDMTTWWLTCSSICVQIYIYIYSTTESPSFVLADEDSRLSDRNILNFTDMTTWWLTCSSICVQIYIYIYIYISQRLDKKGCMVPSILQFQFKTNIKKARICVKTLFI